RGSHIVVDALDGTAKPGAIGLSTAAGSPVLRIYDSENVVRGLVLFGSQAGGGVQADTVDFMSTAAGNRVEQSIGHGPADGDAVGACGTANAAGIDNQIVDSQLLGAADKGLKADAAHVTIERSCIADNQNGGIQATLGGYITARENVVQSNIPGKAANGI